MKKLTCPDCGREFLFPEHSTPIQAGLDVLPTTLKIVCGRCGYNLEVKYEIRRRTKIMLRRLADQQRRQNATTQNTEKRF
jgi:ribosomal protein S27AE